MLLLGLLVVACGGTSSEADTADEEALNLDTSVVNYAGKKTALVIGNADYRAARVLKNPVNDAEDMAATLERIGFEVIVATNATKADMKQSVREFQDALTRKGGLGLFYYSGHGMQVKGENYLIPVDADIQSESELEDEGFALARAMGAMEEAKNEANIVILDACRDNPLISSSITRGGRTRGLDVVSASASSGMLIWYSTAPNSVAQDGEERNGTFTQALLKYLPQPKMSVQSVFIQTAREVKQKTGGKQTPWQSSSLDQEVYLVSAPPSQPAPQPVVPVTPRTQPEPEPAPVPGVKPNKPIPQHDWSGDNDDINEPDEQNVYNFNDWIPGQPQMPSGMSSSSSSSSSSGTSISTNTVNGVTTTTIVKDGKTTILRNGQVISESPSGSNKTAREYFESASAKYEQQDYPGTIADCTNAIWLDPKHANAYAWRGLAKYGLGNKSGACQDWSKAAQLGNSDAYKWVQEYCN